MIIYMIYCLIPLIDGGYFNFELFKGGNDHILFILINATCVIFMIYKNITQHAMSRKRDPRKAVKGKAERSAPDANWKHPTTPGKK